MLECKINVIFSTFHLSWNVIELISLQFKRRSTECPGHAECGKINLFKTLLTTFKNQWHVHRPSISWISLMESKHKGIQSIIIINNVVTVRVKLIQAAFFSRWLATSLYSYKVAQRRLPKYHVYYSPLYCEFLYFNLNFRIVATSTTVISFTWLLHTLRCFRFDACCPRSLKPSKFLSLLLLRSSDKTWQIR